MNFEGLTHLALESERTSKKNRWPTLGLMREKIGVFHGRVRSHF